MNDLLIMVNYTYYIRYRSNGYVIGLSTGLYADWIFYYASR